jgi:hypothetical protein
MNGLLQILGPFLMALFSAAFFIRLARQSERTVVLGEPPGKVSYPWLYWAGLFASAFWTLLMLWRGSMALIDLFS